MEFDPPTLRKVELASEEALVNIIRHAYQELPGEIEIEVRAFPHSHVEIVIQDRGPPFDPLEEDREVDRTSSLEEREEGGLGIIFIRKYMDDVRYQRRGDQNVLTLVKKLAS
jgi:anti-sigma regulatory factor (Ser/Thr protein kinase)